MKEIAFVLGLFGFDQFTKYLFYDMALGQGLLLLTPSFNFGIAWSLPVPLDFVVVLSFLVLFFVLFLLYGKHSLGSINLGRRSRVALLFFVAGTLGNLLDRILLGGVRDFIDFQFFPVFNLADVFLTIAVMFLLVSELWGGQVAGEQ